MSQNQRTITFTHAVLEGTAYEIGRKQGELIKNIPEFVHFMTSPFKGCAPLTPHQAEETFRLFERYCPGLNEEIHGFADALGVLPEHVIYYSFTHQRDANCSQLVALPQATKTGHTYVGRSYEWSYEDDFRLVTTRTKGVAAHLGFSLLFFGRLDGVNEYGLSVTMTAGAPMVQPEESGLKFWAVVRTLLDRAHSVDEALQILADIPISFYLNLLLADKAGHAALVEIACSKRAVTHIDSSSPQSTLFSTNHFSHAAMLQHDKNRMWQSVVRYQAIERGLKKLPINKEHIRSILSKPFPDGVCCHHYSDGLGTLWSAIYDLTAGQVEICLGSPVHNKWRSFDLSGQEGITEYPVLFIDEAQADPASFYRRLEPGSEK